MSAAILSTEPMFAGDTWPGIPDISIRPNNQIPAAAAASAEVTFFKAEDGPVTPELTLSSPDNITITDADNWEFNVPDQPLALSPGEWTFRFRTTDADGVIRTWITGTQLIL